MSGSRSGSSSMLSAKRVWLIAICVGCVALGGAAFADNDRGRGHDKKFRGEQHSWVRDRERDHRRDRHHDHRRDDRRDWDQRSQGRRDSYRRDWRFSNGRYWAPPEYRGRHCNDRRHFHGVHFHVAARDYYDYYYPRYRYYGSRPLGADASVIITLPLF